MFVLEYLMTFVLQWWNASGVSCGERAVLAWTLLLLRNLREKGNDLYRFNSSCLGLSARHMAIRCVCRL